MLTFEGFSFKVVGLHLQEAKIWCYSGLKSADVCEADTKMILVTLLISNQIIVQLQTIWEPKLLAVLRVSIFFL